MPLLVGCPWTSSPWISPPAFLVEGFFCSLLFPGFVSSVGCFVPASIQVAGGSPAQDTGVLSGCAAALSSLGCLYSHSSESLGFLGISFQR